MLTNDQAAHLTRIPGGLSVIHGDRQVDPPHDLEEPFDQGVLGIRGVIEGEAQTRRPDFLDIMTPGKILGLFAVLAALGYAGATLFGDSGSAPGYSQSGTPTETMVAPPSPTASPDAPVLPSRR